MTMSAKPPASVGLRIPDFFIIGHEKCGTTALFNLLRQHPGIFMPELKEPRFFYRDRLQPDAGEQSAGVGEDLRPRTLEAYLSLFADARPEQRAGEASPQYIRSHDAARLIAQVQPDARIIAVLREPTSLVRTFHLNNLLALVETERDLRKAIALEGPRRQGIDIPSGSRAPDRLFYCEHVRYVEQLRRFDSHFPAEQILVIVYDDFRRDNDATLRRILRFLDVDD
ncbi:MAG: sulfotransferase, partial [Solirubrobacterales bacterium]|nr:sulfotransferase [Solirubrobacterales bacterium]